MPTRFFSATARFFSEGDISPQVLTVLPDTRFEGRHFLVRLFLVEPQALPFSSVHFSLNHLLSAKPFLVFLTATLMFCLYREASIYRSPGVLYKFTRMLHKLIAVTRLHPVM